MNVCVECGIQLACMRNGAFLFNGDLTKYRHGDAYQCSQCGQSIITAWGDNYMERSEEEIEEIIDRRSGNDGEWDGYLDYDEKIHDKEPLCLECDSLMLDHGEGILFLSTGHAYKKGKIWKCPFCDYKIIEVGYEGWPPPLSEEEKNAVVEKYQDKVFYLSR